MTDDETMFDRFWQASSLDRFNIPQFANQLNAYDSDTKELLLEYPQTPIVLPDAKTKLNVIAQKRKSVRAFSTKELSMKELGCVLSSFYAWNGLEHRGYASAGATYATEVFCVAFNAQSYTGKVLYYDPEKHGVVVVSDDAPSWDDASTTLNVKVNGTPQLLVILTSIAERATDKYGERGGRFALIELGAAMQQLSLQIAASKHLKGVAIGGMLDDEWLRILGLKHTQARIGLGYLVGT